MICELVSLSVLSIHKHVLYACKWHVQIKGAKVSSLFASNWKSQSTREAKHQKARNWVLVVIKAQGYVTLIVVKDDEPDFH
jgi:hypothetical protein